MDGNAPACSKIVLEKMKNTCIEKYGKNNFTKTEEFKERYENTCLNKYGVKNIFQKEDLKEKNAKIQLEKGWVSIQQWKNDIIPLFSKEEYFENYGMKNNFEYEWKCVKCGNIFKQAIYTTHFNKDYANLPRCLKCHPFGANSSQKELELLNFIKNYFPNAKKDKSLIKPLEIDIIIPEIKLAIEFNGLYYHSLNRTKGVTKGYHLNKTKLCNEKGYRLLHIWENEWDENKEEIKNKLIDIFNHNEHIEAEDELILDRSWFNNIHPINYELVKILEPEIKNVYGLEIEDCGKLIYKKSSILTMLENIVNGNAELNKEADKKFKEDQDTLNKADSMIFNLEKQMKDLSGKLPADLESQLNEKISVVKSQKDAKDIEGLKKSTEELQQLAMKMGEEIYKNAQAAGNSNGNSYGYDYAENDSKSAKTNPDGSVDAEVVS